MSIIEPDIIVIRKVMKLHIYNGWVFAKSYIINFCGKISLAIARIVVVQDKLVHVHLHCMLKILNAILPWLRYSSSHVRNNTHFHWQSLPEW